MEIIISRNEVLELSNDWEKFCEEFGWSVWCCNEGAGDAEISLTKEEAIKYGLIGEK